MPFYLIHRLLEELLTKWRYRPKWTFCGDKHPWIEITGSNHIALLLHALNAIHIPAMTMHYQVYDFHLHDYYRELMDLRRVTIPLLRSMLIHAKPLITVLTRRFHIVAQPGKVLRFVNTTCISCTAMVGVYDGFDYYHKIFESPLKSEYPVIMAKYSQYFRTHVIVQFDDTDLSVDQIWKMSIKLHHVRALTITEKYELELDNRKNDSIINTVLMVNITGTQFPRLSIKSRISVGLNEDGCAYGGLMIKQYRNESVFNEYGPYCSRLMAFQPFLTGLNELVFPSDPFKLFVYAFGPLYTLAIDIIVSITECEGLINPVELCLSNDTVSQVPVGQSHQPTNYKLFCKNILSTLVSGDVYISIVMHDLKGCVVVQQIPTTSDMSYIIRFTDHSNIAIWIATPVLSTRLMGLTNWGLITFHASQSNIITTTNNQVIRYLYIPTAMLSYVTRFEFHKLMFHLQTRKREVIQICEKYNESSHTVWRDKFVEYRYFLSVTNICGVGTYSKNYIYVYSFTAGVNRMAHFGRKQIVYTSIITSLTADCIAKDKTDRVAIVIPTIYSDSIEITDRMFNVTLYSMLWVLVLEKQNPCSSVVIKFGQPVVVLTSLLNITSSYMKVGYK